MADQVLYSGVACITDLMVKEGLINLDFADVRAVMGEMGKAMMGTGEASGEKRAITAAEAAISNPLLDEVSMRGARGLLISITGGKDLTLYEVDEAATRIREEVDPDANIILGATFDQSLEGLVRVSVVATGIESIATPTAISNAAERNFAERMRAIASINVERETVHTRTESRPVFEPRREFLHKEIDLTGALNGDDEQDASPAPEAEIDDVKLRPLAPRPSLFQPMEESHREEVEDEPIEPFIPPQAERPSRPPRMPRIDELPIPAQNQIRAQRGEPNENAAIETKRMTLLRRLANIGNGRREEAAATEPNHLPRTVVKAREPDGRPVTDRRPPEQVSEYFRRPEARGPKLDVSNRPAPIHVEEDELEIPAFLRRQAN
jgi:cell division protein FtsZ